MGGSSDKHTVVVNSCMELSQRIKLDTEVVLYQIQQKLLTGCCGSKISVLLNDARLQIGVIINILATSSDERISIEALRSGMNDLELCIVNLESEILGLLSTQTPQCKVVLNETLQLSTSLRRCVGSKVDIIFARHGVVN